MRLRELLPEALNQNAISAMRKMITDKSTPHHEREAARGMLKKHGHSEIETAGDRDFGRWNVKKSPEWGARKPPNPNYKSDFEQAAKDWAKRPEGMKSPYKTHDHAKVAMVHGFQYKEKMNYSDSPKVSRMFGDGGVKYTYKHPKGHEVHVYVNHQGGTDAWRHNVGNFETSDAESLHQHLKKHGLFA